MIQLLSIILLLATHFITGYGLLRLLRCRLSTGMYLSLSLIAGIGIVAAVPFLLQLLTIPLTEASIFITLLLIVTAFSIPAFSGKQPVQWKRPRIPALYEWPALLLICFITFVSVWRCYYNPVSARDMLTGPEVIANYTLVEHSMVNSVFNIDMTNNNNQFKPASIASLQVVYKMAGFPFGQVWLSIVFLSFTLFLYQVLRQNLHPLLAGLLLLLFTAIPEMYAYTFLILFDYTNAVFFTISCFFLFQYFSTTRRSDLALSALFMAFAVYFRAETLLLAYAFIPALLLHLYRQKVKAGPALLLMACFCVPPFIAYWLPNGLYNKYYLPIHYDISGLINSSPFDLLPLWVRFRDMNTSLVFGNLAITLYGYFSYLFMALLLLELLWKRKLSLRATYWLLAIAIVYLGLPLLGHLITLIDLQNTTKRGLFKIFPLMLLFLANSQLLAAFSQWIYKWENSSWRLKKQVPAG